MSDVERALALLREGEAHLAKAVANYIAARRVVEDLQRDARQLAEAGRT